ncbi:endothelin-converting enzyme 1-like [Haemaphysalis longicornis]
MRSRSKLETLVVLVTLDRCVPVLSHQNADTHVKRPRSRTLRFTCNPCTFQRFATRNALHEEGPVLAYFGRASATLNGSAAPKRTVQEDLKMPVRVLVLKTAALPLLMDPRPDYELLHIVIKQTDYITAPYLSAAECPMVVNRHLPVHAFGRGDEMFVLNKRLLRLVAIPVSNIEDSTGLLAYVNWHVVRHLEPMTSCPLPRTQFMDGRDADKSSLGYMTGRCYTDADAALPLAFTHVFNRRWLAARSVRNATASLCRFRSVARATIAPLPWTDGEMRRGALEKLAILRAVVGFFDQGSGNEEALRRLYPRVPELSGSYLNMSLALHETELNVSKGFLRLHGPTSKEVGFPPVVNASYVPVYHVIVIPAAILYPRCYVACYPSSYNLASLGHDVGHEITHAFHPDEALSSPDGLRRDWWTPASSKKFARQLACQRCLNNETPWTGTARYGAHALSKNRAVSGGLLKAYRAYRGSVALQHSGAAQQGTAFTGEQFFASSCFKWCSNDDRGPVCSRCNEPLMNISELAQAFDCALGSAMDQTNTVWYSLLGARCNVPLMNMPEFAQ